MPSDQQHIMITTLDITNITSDILLKTTILINIASDLTLQNYTNK
ncbi:hypothetical protein XF_0162 [Xylella fastidiosa 9a5c]|uniref:Uncharacterized protein n=1 Tax=Xylella fastidiosa (strain 9a5c) TaxID=160492 RepID=Q9PGY4_XYLFA|nr:hypothetical protein XF_0162 [Xylella fastidiosa 9a5c]